MKTDDLKALLKEQILRRPDAVIALAHLSNLIEAFAKQRHLANGRKLERSKERDLEQLTTYESVIALIEGLIDKENKEGIYDGIRTAQ